MAIYTGICVGGELAGKPLTSATRKFEYTDGKYHFVTVPYPEVIDTVHEISTFSFWRYEGIANTSVALRTVFDYYAKNQRGK